MQFPPRPTEAQWEEIADARGFDWDSAQCPAVFVSHLGNVHTFDPTDPAFVRFYGRFIRRGAHGLADMYRHLVGDWVAFLNHANILSDVIQTVWMGYEMALDSFPTRPDNSFRSMEDLYMYAVNQGRSARWYQAAFTLLGSHSQLY